MKLLQSNTTLMLAIALMITGASVLFGPLFAGRSEWPPTGPTDFLTAPASRDGYTDKLIEAGQERVKQNPADAKAYSELALAFIQKSRETNDPTHYAQAEAAFEEALELDPSNYDALAGLGTLELGRHDFAAALEWGKKAQALRPDRAFAYGVMGDAYIELGKYDEAVESFQRMVDLRPDLASYSRVSYARELHGDVAGAIEAMEKAVAAGGLTSENTAWCRVQLGNLFFNSGRLKEAEATYTEALAGYPGYPHALAALGQVRWAQGRLDEAIELYRKAIDVVRLPHFVAALGDLYALDGDEAAAKEQYDLALFAYTSQEADGMDVAAETALFLAEHGLDPEEAVRLAEKAAEARNDVNTLDALAWSLYGAGKYAEALEAMQKAMRLGTKSAAFHYHLGKIYEGLRDMRNAEKHIQQAVDINPNFSMLHSAEARKYLEGK